MRPGQHNNKRGRSRSRHHSGGSSGGSSGGNGGNPLSRVYESNGPDVKVRGTAQTIAEKYLQLARDAQSSSDIVMGESFYQHAEHYLRIVSAAQAYAQQNQPQQFRRPDDEDDDEGDGDEGGSQGSEQPSLSQAEQPDSGNEMSDFDANDRASQPQPYRQQRDYRDREQRPNNPQPQQPQGTRERFRPRWQERRDRPPGNDSRDGGFQPRETFVQPVPEEQPRIVAAPVPAPANGNVAEEPRQWEAPSFLRRPAALPAAETVAAADEVAAPERKRPGRKPRRDPAPALESADPGPGPAPDPDSD